MKKLLSIICMIFLYVSICSNSFGLDKSLVALSQLKATGSNSFVGRAITQMLVTRLYSEGIDCFLLTDERAKEKLEIADFLLSGEIHDKGGIFDTIMVLKEPKEGKILKRWHFKSQNLEALARDVSLYSAKIADHIKNTGDVLNTFSSMTDLVQKGEGTKIKNDFQLAKMHPDKLVRENLEKDEAKEIAEERKRQEQEENERIAQVPPEQEDTESWMPIPDPYDKETDEEDPAGAKLEPIPSNKHGNSTGNKKSWYSWLWPFGDSEEEKEQKRKKELLVANAPKLNKDEKKAPKVVAKSDDVPIPSPPRVDFNIPEPVSMDVVYKELEKIEVEKRKKERDHWYSWLWPFGGEEEETPVKIDLEEEKEETKHKMASSKEIGEAIDSFALSASSATNELNKTQQNHSINGEDNNNMKVQKPEEAFEESSSIDADVLDETSNKKIIAPSRPSNLDGPIWQWN